MSIVIIGGHERMETQYKDICKRYKCKAKVFTKMKTDLKSKIGCPDLMILFTSTASHKMVHCAMAESERNHAAIERSHSSSASALIGILEQYV
ncbi:MAG: DUF2325 domain-containing protein [Lachnospiraceae bacterium]|nr:DUF2325 domain-containing protein [Lachnospiraceae bacterium]MDD3615823.1 DUF2325 domain-containing protein [Lachnospiraceae bacterium]